MGICLGNNNIKNIDIGSNILYKAYLGNNLLYKKPTIYGWRVDPSISDPSQAVTYLADAVGKTPAAMGAYSFSYGGWEDAFFMPKPCMLRSDGTVAYYLDPNDYTKKADGTPSDVGNAAFDGNAMMEWPLIWYKFSAGEADGEGYFYCSDKQVDESYHCWCSYDANDNIIPHFYTAIYNGTGTSKMRSLSGVTLTPANGNGNTTGTQEIARATANNTTSTVEWYIDVLSDRLLISALMILISKSLNNQASFGKGIVTGNQSDKEAYVTGTLNDKGLFWGSTTSNTYGVKIFGMENWYGCTFRRTAGLLGTSTGYAVKLTYGTADGSGRSGYYFIDAGYLTVPNKPSSSNYVSKMQFSDKGFFPLEVSGSSSTYWTEFFRSGAAYALFGSLATSGGIVASTSVRLDDGLDVYAWDYAAAISCKPCNTTSAHLT